jgi:hypothetical protein
MCRLRSLVIGAVIGVAALDFSASPAITGLVTDVINGVRASPSDTFAAQSVDRTRKADRLTPRDGGRYTPAQRTPASQPSPIPDGCSPAFSPLSSSARLNYPVRCVA